MKVGYNELVGKSISFTFTDATGGKVLVLQLQSTQEIVGLVSELREEFFAVIGLGKCKVIS